MWRLAWRAARSRTVLSIGGQGFASGANFATGLIIGRLCAPEEYGLYFLGFTLLNFGIEMQNALIATPYMVYAPRLGPGEAPRYSGSVLLHQFAFCGVATVVFALAALAATQGLGPAGMAPVFAALALVAGLALLRDFVRRIAFATLRVGSALLVDAGVALLQVGGLLGLAALGWLNATTAYAALGLATGAAALTWLLAHRRLFAPAWPAARRDLATNWTLARWAFASAVLWSLSLHVYPWLVTYFHGAAAAGLWAACVTIVNLGNIVMMGVQNFLGPKIAATYAAEGPRALRRLVLAAGALVSLPLLVLAVGMVRFGDEAVVLLYGTAYAGQGVPLTLLVLNLLALTIGFTFSRGLFALERADLDFWVNGIALLVLVTAGVALVRAHGVTGAASALLLANVAALLVRAAVFFRALPRTAEGSP